MTEKDTIEKRSVSGMQTDFHLLYPPDYDRNKAVPMKDYKFIQALKIDAMVILIKESYRGVADLSLENFFLQMSGY